MNKIEQIKSLEKDIANLMWIVDIKSEKLSKLLENKK